jgi:hypothetical protein
LRTYKIRQRKFELVGRMGEDEREEEKGSLRMRRF